MPANGRMKNYNKRKKTTSGWQRLPVFYISCQLHKKTKLAIQSFLPFSNTVADPLLSPPPHIISADITPRQHICGKEGSAWGDALLNSVSS